MVTKAETTGYQELSLFTPPSPSNGAPAMFNKTSLVFSIFINAVLFSLGCGSVASESELLEDSFKHELTVLDFNAYLLNGIGSNLHVDERLKIMPEQLASTNADIITLQEVWEIEHRTLLIEELSKLGYPHAIFYEKPEGRTGWDKLGNGMLIFSKFKPASEPKFEQWKTWTRLLERKSSKGVMRVDLEVAEGKIVSVFNAHTSTKQFTEDGYKPKHIAKRIEQVEQITSFMKKASEETEGATQIVGLDLNTHPTTWNNDAKIFGTEPASEYVRLLEDGNLVDSYEDAHPGHNEVTADHTNNAWCSTGVFKKEPSTFIDYVMTTKGQSKVVSSEIVFREQFDYVEPAFSAPLSDHYGILTKIKL